MPISSINPLLTSHFYLCYPGPNTRHNRLTIRAQGTPTSNHWCKLIVIFKHSFAAVLLGPQACRAKGPMPKGPLLYIILPTIRAQGPIQTAQAVGLKGPLGPHTKARRAGISRGLGEFPPTFSGPHSTQKRKEKPRAQGLQTPSARPVGPVLGYYLGLWPRYLGL